MQVNLTEKAVSEVKRIIAEQTLDLDKTYLRVRVTGGGCSGFQTKLDIDENFNEKTDIEEKVEGIRIAIDKKSALYLDGVKIDFYSDLNKMGFVIDVPGTTGRCGCGSSFNF
jgi:iron-sulfur cluster assembly accessory protein